MMNKHIWMLHLIFLGIIVGRLVQFHNVQNLLSLGIFFFFGFTALDNIINRMLIEKEKHI